MLFSNYLDLTAQLLLFTTFKAHISLFRGCEVLVKSRSLRSVRLFVDPRVRHVAKMSTEEKVLYYEDIEVKARTEAAEDDDAKKKTSVISTSVAKTKTTTSSASAPLKRQRTLMEMMSVSSKDTKTSEQPAKKAKLSTSVTPKTPSASTSVKTGIQPLNSIPFSMQGFKDSLTEEQRDLLLLECETMGKSWCVHQTSRAMCSLNSSKGSRSLRTRSRNLILSSSRSFSSQRALKGLTTLPQTSSPHVRHYICAYAMGIPDA